MPASVLVTLLAAAPHPAAPQVPPQSPADSSAPSTARVEDLSESGASFVAVESGPGRFALRLLTDPVADPPVLELRGEVGERLVLRFPAAVDGFTARVWDGPGAWTALEPPRAPAWALDFSLRRPREVIELLPPGRGGARATGYSFAQLSSYLTGLPADPRLSIQILGSSAQGREIVKVVFDDRTAPMPAPWKRTVVALVRQHGNEWGSSYVFEGMLDYLLGRNGWVPDPKVTEQVRFVFYPMVNPDGVESDQRYNANGYDLNRNWSATGPAAWQQPETYLIQSDLASLPFPETVRVGGDHHGWWSGVDGGFRYDDGGAPASVSHAEYLEAVKDTARYTLHDPGVFQWYENGGQAGMARVELHAWKGWLLHTPEYDTPSSRDEQRLRQIGTNWVQAMRDTVYAAEIRVGAISLGAGTPVGLRGDEDDENRAPTAVETAELYLADWASGDRERAVLVETGPDTGVFELQPGFPVAGGPAARWDGVLQTSPGSWVIAAYTDPDLPSDRCFAGAPVVN